MTTNLTTEKRLSIKRRLATESECQIDLINEIPLMFSAFKEAFSNYEKEIIQTPVEARARAFEASLLNSKMIHSIQNNFPNKWKYGKYKRFILRVEGYSILFKKLNGKDRPMNINTKYSNAISNQFAMSLFEEDVKSIDPILFFGYKKDKVGNIKEPKLVYIDDNLVKWTINEDNIEQRYNIKSSNVEVTEKVMPKIKVSVASKKAANDK